MELFGGYWRGKGRSQIFFGFATLFVQPLCSLTDKSFLLLFFKKEALSSFLPPKKHQPSFVNTIVPDAANMPPTPWQTEIFAPCTCAGAVPRIWRMLSWRANMPYMPVWV